LNYDISIYEIPVGVEILVNSLIDEFRKNWNVLRLKIGIVDENQNTSVDESANKHTSRRVLNEISFGVAADYVHHFNYY
jgi:hypothetical protein